MGVNLQAALGHERSHGMPRLGRGQSVFTREQTHHMDAFNVFSKSVFWPLHLVFGVGGVESLPNRIQNPNFDMKIIQISGEFIIAGAIFLHARDHAVVSFGIRGRPMMTLHDRPIAELYLKFFHSRSPYFGLEFPFPNPLLFHYKKGTKK